MRDTAIAPIALATRAASTRLSPRDRAANSAPAKH